MIDPVILVHGGAFAIPDFRVNGKVQGTKIAAKSGYCTLEEGGSALDAVECAVRCMEDDKSFNAGHGAAININGEIELDASIMEGTNLRAGAVAAVKDIANPICLARRMMEKSAHVLLVSHGANIFASEEGFPNTPSESLIIDYARKSLEEFKQRKNEKNLNEGGTVGAVAVDKYGHVAAATSTGGICGKMVGRVGDTAIIGSGTYADDNIGAVSSTGHGETILKYCLAHSVIKSMETGMNAQEATEFNIALMTKRLNNTAGAITVSNKGEIGFAFTTKRMAWAYKKGNQLHFGIDPNQHEIELDE